MSHLKADFAAVFVSIFARFIRQENAYLIEVSTALYYKHFIIAWKH